MSVVKASAARSCVYVMTFTNKSSQGVRRRLTDGQLQIDCRRTNYYVILLLSLIERSSRLQRLLLINSSSNRCHWPRAQAIPAFKNLR